MIQSEDTVQYISQVYCCYSSMHGEEKTNGDLSCYGDRLVTIGDKVTSSAMDRRKDCVEMTPC